MPWPTPNGFGITENPLIDSPFVVGNAQGGSGPFPSNSFLLLNGSHFLLLNGNFLELL